MKKYDLLKDVLNLVEEFENIEQNKKLDLENFISWTVNKLSKSSDSEVTEPVTLESGKMKINNEIAAYIFRLNKFASFYTKETLSDLPLISINDFGFVARVHSKGPLTKMELIRYVLVEKSPGMEIIKRLIAKDVFEEFENPDDKRGKMIRLTAFGEAVFQDGFKRMSSVANKIAADIEYEEKLRFLNTLRHLEQFHLKLFNEK